MGSSPAESTNPSCQHQPETIITLHCRLGVATSCQFGLADAMNRQMQLITLGQDSSGADESCCSSQLVQDICKRLLQPSVPLSVAAARKLRQQCARANAAIPPEGALLRSLPVELLYDDAGLDLFDQITQVGSSNC